MRKNSCEIIGMSSIINNRLQHHSHTVHNHINYTIVNLCYLLSIFRHFILFAYTLSQISMKWDDFVWIVPLIFAFWIGSRFTLTTTSSVCLAYPFRIQRRLTNCQLIPKHYQNENECNLFEWRQKHAMNPEHWVKIPFIKSQQIGIIIFCQWRYSHLKAVCAFKGCLCSFDAIWVGWI